MFGARRREREQATALVLQVTQDFVKARGLERTVSLESQLSKAELGLDSIARLELIAEVERQGSLTIPERFWESTNTLTVGQLVDIVLKSPPR